MMCSGNIKESNFIGTLFIIATRHFDRVARITNIKELNTLDHTTIINVEARNNTFS